MAWIIAFVLAGIWSAALAAGVTLGGYVHIVLAVSIGVVVFHIRSLRTAPVDHLKRT